MDRLCLIRDVFGWAGANGLTQPEANHAFKNMVVSVSSPPKDLYTHLGKIDVASVLGTLTLNMLRWPTFWTHQLGQK